MGQGTGRQDVHFGDAIKTSRSSRKKALQLNDKVHAA
jgi:hypothetical protein